MSTDEMLVGAAKEVSAGAADHQCCRILTAVPVAAAIVAEIADKESGGGGGMPDMSGMM